MRMLIDDHGNAVQVVELQPSGKTINIASAAGVSVSASVLNGLYRIATTIDAKICTGNNALTTDMPIYAGSTEYMYIDNAKLATFCAAIGGIISATLIE